ncbi:IncF plasmid conjugative transfer surface exclusion protein TraT [uncultured Candidatus Thioglobus sp.]|nr:IncF plasmid conjugative transfer surface exclusion protein TraT [uncultured Candidatus Thioglobus sp.]
MKNFNILLIALLLLISGCSTITEQDIKPVNPDTVTIKVLVDRSIFVEEPPSDSTAIFVRVRDTSGEGLNLQQNVLRSFKSQGFNITTDIKKANYVLQANVKDVGQVSAAEMSKLQDSTYGEEVATILKRSLTGVLAGGVVGSLDGNAAKGALIGAGIGALTGAFEASARAERIARKKAMKYIALVVDVSVKEQLPDGSLIERKGVSKKRSNSNSTGNTGDDRFSSNASDSSFETDNYTTKTKWKRSNTRILVKAKGRHLKFEDVKDRMSRKLVSSISGFF